MVEKEIQEALMSQEPIDALTNIAIQLKAQGMNNENIYNVFLKYYNGMNDTNNTKDILGDFMDMITGWYQGHNIEL